MTAKETLQQLKSMGTAQNRKVYGRHGVGENQYGVSYANLKKLAKKIKVDHELAEQLWSTGNHDARMLAAMVADPAAATRSSLDAWARDLDCYPLADAFAGYVAKTLFAREKSEKWAGSKKEFTGQAAWNLVSHLAMGDESLPDSYFEKLLGTIESQIHSRQNRVRYSMNNALIAIGIRNSKLEKKSLAAAKKIGKVEVDHGETSCKTPDAAAYIQRVKKRKAAKA